MIHPPVAPDIRHGQRIVRIEAAFVGNRVLPLLLPGAYVVLEDARAAGPFPGVHLAYQSVLKPRVREIGWGSPMLLVRLES